MTTNKTIEDLIQHQISKLEQFKNAHLILQLAKTNKNVKREICEKHKRIMETDKKLTDLKLALEYQKNLCEEIQKLRTRMQSLKNEVQLINDYLGANKENESGRYNNSGNSVSYVYSPLDVPKQDFKTIPAIKPVTLTTELLEVRPLSNKEYISLPKYLVGRVTLEIINKFVDSMNQALHSKYELLAKCKFSLKPKEKLLYGNYKKQECLETKGKYFITEHDIAAAQHLKKLDKRGFNILTMLRHSHRITELRGGGIVRYLLL